MTGMEGGRMNITMEANFAVNTKLREQGLSLDARPYYHGADDGEIVVYGPRMTQLTNEVVAVDDTPEAVVERIMAKVLAANPRKTGAPAQDDIQ